MDSECACLCVFVCLCGGGARPTTVCVLLLGRCALVVYTSYFQPRETSSEKATGGLTHCCTFKGQIAHIYATACHRQEEWLLPRKKPASMCIYVCVRASVCKGRKEHRATMKVDFKRCVFLFVWVFFSFSVLSDLILTLF